MLFDWKFDWNVTRGALNTRKRCKKSFLFRASSSMGSWHFMANGLMLPSLTSFHNYQNHIAIDHDLNISIDIGFIHSFPGRLGLWFLRHPPFLRKLSSQGIDCGRRYVSLLGPILGGVGKYCACALAANGQLGQRLEGEFGEKKGGQKRPDTRFFSGSDGWQCGWR